MVARHKRASSQAAVELILGLQPRLHVKEGADKGLPDTLIIGVNAKLVFDQPRRGRRRIRMTHLVFGGSVCAELVLYELLCLGLPVQTTLLLLILLRHVHLDELGDEMTVSTMTIGDSSEPIILDATRFHQVSSDSFAIGCDAGDKDRVLIDLRRASATHVSGHREAAILAYDEVSGSASRLIGNAWAAVLWHSSIAAT